MVDDKTVEILKNGFDLAIMPCLTVYGMEAEVKM